MKFFVFVCLFLVSLSASAELIPVRPCTTEDWNRIVMALNVPAQSGEEFRGEVQSLLTNPVAPQCTYVPESKVAPTIPGEKHYKYFLTSGERGYGVRVVVGGVERPGSWAYITKRK